MAIGIRSGAARVVASGTVTTFGGQPLVFDLPAPENMRIELRFRTDETVPGVAVDSEALPEGYVFELVNFDDTQGRGSARPVLIGERGDDLVFLHFRVMRFGLTEDRTVFYTFFRTNKGAVGWRPVVQEEGSG